MTKFSVASNLENKAFNFLINDQIPEAIETLELAEDAYLGFLNVMKYHRY